MIKIGFADYFLNNWHCDHYPGFLREVIAAYGYDAKVTHAFGIHKEPPYGGVPSEEWCRERNLILCDSMEQLVEEVDAIMVIAADDALWHEEVCQIPLRSGKPVFVDKTFAPSLEVGKRLFQLAEEHGTPIFSSSAQRYCQSIIDYKKKHTELPNFVSTVGPHSLNHYAVHQLEPIVTLMGTGVKRIKGFPVGSAVTQLILDYGDGRMANFVQSPQPWAEFNFMVSDGESGERLVSDDRNFYHNLSKAIMDFFVHGIVPVRKEETLEILALIDAARETRKHPDTWIDIVY